MTIDIEKVYWPSLGLYVCDFIESELRHGPGPVRGQAVTLTKEEQRFIYRMYEVHPKEECGRPHCNCSQRVGTFRYEWAIYCRLKGARKSELTGWISHVELYGPCRFAGWDAEGEPVAASVWDLGGTADIPFAATAEDQARDTAWSSFYDIAQSSTWVDRLDINKDKVSVKVGGAGNARVVTSSSISRDGGRPTFTVEEEPHLWTSKELIELNDVLEYNLAKLGSSDPHGLKVSTMYGVGEQSVLERDHMAAMNDPDSGILFDLRSAPDTIEVEGKRIPLDPKNDDHVIYGITEAIGDAEWLDPYRIYRKFKKSRERAIRYWWNKRSVSDRRAIDPDNWDKGTHARPLVPGETICIGFDGSLYQDSTAIVVSCLSDGYQWPALIHYPDGTEQGVNALREAVELTLFDLTSRYRLVRMYYDPPHWGEQGAKWQGTYGQQLVVPYWTNRDSPMTWAVHRWAEGIEEQTWLHSDDAEFRNQVVNAFKRITRIIVDVNTGGYGWVIQKETPDSPKKIDAAIASVLAAEARTDALKSGADVKKRSGKVVGF